MFLPVGQLGSYLLVTYKHLYVINQVKISSKFYIERIKKLISKIF